MKNMQVKSIDISTNKRSKSKFNLAHDVNTTFSWGETQPLMCRLMSPGTKNVLQTDSLVRLAPMVAPTFGRIKYKQWHQFVDIADIFPNFPNFMSQTPVAGASHNGVVVSEVPQVPIAYLTSLCLIGAKANVYARADNPDIASTLPDADKIWYNSHVTDLNQSVPSNIYYSFLSSGIFSGNGTTLMYPFSSTTSMHYMDLGKLWDYAGLSTSISSMWSISFPSGSDGFYDLPSANVKDTSFMEITNEPYPSYRTDNALIGSCDLSVGVTIPNSSSPTSPYNYLITFKLSSFGKRLRKILIGLGYQLDLMSLDTVSVLPILAYYKAYWDLFGLTKFRGYEVTPLYHITRFMTSSPQTYSGISFFGQCLVKGSTVTYSVDTFSKCWLDLIIEIGNSFVTELPDYIGAHTSDLSSGPKSTGLDFIDTTSISSRSISAITTTGNASGSVVSGVTSASNYPVAGSLYGNNQNRPYLNNSTGNGLTGFLSGLTIESLQRLYRWTNKNSIVGMEIANLLKAQGYGYFVYSCKSNFIGYEETYVTISDVVSQSDTYDTNNSEGAILGQYGGRGLQYNESKSFDFETDSFGYWVTLAAIVPESGFNQGIDPALFAKDKFDFYNPEFDGLGMEVTPLPVVAGSAPIHTNDSPMSGKGFGYIPRYSGFKVAQNINNGDYSLRSRQTDYLPFQLDKNIPYYEPWIGAPQDLTSTERITEVWPMLKWNNLPTAGEIWRYVARYPWLGRFDRIFAANNERDGFEMLFSETADPLGGVLEFLVNFSDNFNVHNVLNLQSYAPMLPIEQSFGTESHNGGFDAAMDKT